MQYHTYDGLKIPVLTSTRRSELNRLYNMPQDEIDRMRCDTLFTDDGDCMEPGGFRGVSMEDAGLPRFDDQEIRERLEFQKRERAGIAHLFRDHKVPAWHQNGHGYCWGYGAARALLAALLVEGLSFRDLDPHPTCAYAKGGRDVGGWASDFLKAADKVGVALAGMLPRHSLNPRNILKPEVQETAVKPLEWVNIPRGDMPALRSLLVTNNAAGMGRMWWGHLYADIALDWSDKLGWLYLGDNSHGRRFGLNGWFWQTEDVARHGGGSTVRVAA